MVIGKMRIITIGRSSKSDVVVHDTYVGRIHMQIVLDDDGNIYAVDMNSTNGTYVNGRRITGKVCLQKNDVIRIGNTTLPWQKYISTTIPGVHRNNSITYVIISVLILLLACAGIYFRNINNINNSKESESAETFQDYNTCRSDNNVSRTEKIRNKNEKPSINSIPYDLIGHKLSEGVSEGYHKKDWTYTIENNSITNFSCDEILTNDSNSYLIISSFHLKGGNNFYYDTRAKISYINNGNGWELNYVNSLGMFVVSDGQYDDCIVCEIADDGWGGVNCLSIRNISECTLVVGGQIRTYNGWIKFSRPVSPHDSGSVGGTFGGGSVSDYIIEFVVREK